jgi:HEAT repeat protein
MAKEDRSSDARQGALEGLGSYGEKAGSAVNEIIGALDDPDEEIRDMAFWALGELGAAAEEAVPKLMQIVRAEKHEMADEAASVLSKIGKAAIPPLLEYVRGSGDRHRVRPVGTILGRMKASVVPILISALKDRDPFVRRTVLFGFGAMGYKAKDALPALRPLLDDPDKFVRRRAQLAINFIERALPRERKEEEE